MGARDLVLNPLVFKEFCIQINIAGTITNLQTIFWKSLDNEVLYKQAWREQRPDHKGSETKDGVQPSSGTMRAGVLTARGSMNERGWV